MLDLTDNIVGGDGRATRAASCATTTTIPTSSSRPTRAPRRSPTSPTRSQASTASGSATRSPRAARTATTTRRWASPRAARGSRVRRHFLGLGINADKDALHRRRHRRHVRATCSATGCCSHMRMELVGRVRPSPCLPRPDARSRGVVRRAQAAVRPPALVVGRLRPVADLRWRRRLAARSEVDPALAPGPRAARHRRRGTHAGRR